jgi:ankyrin repeat protein
MNIDNLLKIMCVGDDLPEDEEYINDLLININYDDPHKLRLLHEFTNFYQNKEQYRNLSDRLIRMIGFDLKLGSRTPWCIAARNWLFNISKYIFEKNPDQDIDEICGNNETALFIAVQSNNLEVVDWFLKNKANVNFLSYSNRTVLHCYIEYVYVRREMLYLLLGYGVDINAKTKIYGKTAQDLLDKRGVKYNLQSMLDEINIPEIKEPEI